MHSHISPIRVVLTEDHPVVRAGIRDMIRSAEGIELVGDAANGEEALRQVEALRPDVLLLDIELPDSSGVDITRKILADYPEVKILILSGHEDKHYIRALFELGVSGYLTKDEAPGTITDAIRSIAAGETGWVSRRVSSQLSRMMYDETQSPSNLTPREEQVLALVVEGKTNQAIAVHLGISEKTVEKYVENIFRKLGVSSRVEAAVDAVRRSMIEKS
ncbi:MAG TPA: response regulator transcription factor [Anaerolineaceae bacterium]|nr:response regulator transcription factor [Anaerolineaceae bacterium]